MNADDSASREIVWRGLDDPSRLDVVSVEFLADGGFVATGAQSTETYRARWDLLVDTAWRTRMLTVDVEGLGTGTDPVWQRHLNLWRHEDPKGSSVWRCESGESGEVPETFGEIGPSPSDEAALADALDVDLSGCPLTNTMPIRRLGLLFDASRWEQPITTAWVSLPDLAVRPAAQAYGPATGEDAPSAVHYRSETRGVSVDLTLDEDGIVITYPNLSERLDVG